MQTKAETQAFFDKIERNIISIMFADDKSAFLKNEEEMMKEIMTAPSADTFQKLLIAEYKELVYESIYFPHFDQYDYDMMCELERMVIKYYGQEILDNHVHDPTHIMFNDGKHFYMFYEMVESKGKKILDLADEEYDDDY